MWEVALPGQMWITSMALTSKGRLDSLNGPSVGDPGWPGLFATLARLTIRFRWPLLVLWVVGVVAGARAMPSLSSMARTNNAQFLSSSSGGSSEAQQLGYSIAFSILLDIFFVRTLLVPSIALLLGRWNWWPSRLFQGQIAHPPPSPLASAHRAASSAK
jgi:uncharacterized membrane protein YdfJ with MMPL/SSD domain